MKKLCGIDEAGRGPLAGPLVMAGVVLQSRVDGLADSKKLSEARREKLYDLIVASSLYHVTLFEHWQIDAEGISACLRAGLEQIKSALRGYDYLYDGNTSFGVAQIETMVKADSKIAEVSAASILAKVTRDRIMNEYALLYPEYRFDKHKGYGTKAHIEEMRQNGRSAIHRQSFFIKQLDEPTLF